MFPLRQLSYMVDWTSNVLQEHGRRSTSQGELLRFFGVLIVMTRFKFRSRKELWRNEISNKYIPTPCFGRIMPYSKFDDLRRFLFFGSRKSQDSNSASPQKQ